MNEPEYQRLFELEESYWWYVGLRGLVLSQLRKLRREDAPWKILDAGCGTGGLMASLSEMGEVSGVDISPLALEFCRRRGLERISAASVDSLPFADESFDLVTSLDVLCQRQLPSDEKALAEFYRVCRPGGYVLLSLPALPFLRSSHDQAVHSQRRFTARELARKLERAGFRVEKLTYWNSLLFIPQALFRLIRRFRPPRSGGSDLFPLAPAVNRIFEKVLNLERWWLERHRFPIGMSILAVGRRDS